LKQQTGTPRAYGTAFKHKMVYNYPNIFVKQLSQITQPLIMDKTPQVPNKQKHFAISKFSNRLKNPGDKNITYYEPVLLQIVSHMPHNAI